VKASIEKVLSTLVEAVVLVFVVMFLFLQNIRYTIIPTIVVPVALLGTCAVRCWRAGYSINMLTMFGMVLAVGILVDDAIVVVENVERIMAEEGLPPKEATRKAIVADHRCHHRHHAGADRGVRADGVLPGSVGIIYRQFSVTMVAAIGFSALLAMSLTPALCATLLKPVTAGHGHARKGVFGWFNHGLDTVKGRYAGTVGWSLKRTGRLMLIYAALLIRTDLGLHSAVRWVSAGGRSGFYHDRRADAVGLLVRAHRGCRRKGREISRAARRRRQRDVLTGFSFLGQGMNTAQAFITLKDWSERPPGDSAAGDRGRHQPGAVVDPRCQDFRAAAAADR